MKQRLAAADGYTLIELLIVMAILGFILAGIGGLLVSGQRAQSDTSARVAGQGSARMALDRLEFEARCSSYASILNSGAGVALTMPSQCPHATGNIAWCISSGVLTRYASSSTCSGAGITYIDSITTPTPFSLVWDAAGTLPRLQVALAINTTGRSSNTVRLNDAIALRNQVVSLGDPSPVSGAVGSSVTITGSNFKPNTALTVKLGVTTATITSGGTSSSTGAVNTTFTVPFSGNGAYSVSVSDGTNSATSVTKYTVSGSFDGLALTSTSHTGGSSISCSTISAATTCSIGSLGNTGNVAGKPTFETVAAVAVNNTGTAATVSQSVTDEVNPGATASPSSSTIANGASATASAFTLTGLGSGWVAYMKATTTVNGVAYSLTLTGSGP
jgi:prepilin-type N-terminal cleavage/methylation domain-containing protein